MSDKNKLLKINENLYNEIIEYLGWMADDVCAETDYCPCEDRCGAGRAHYLLEKLPCLKY